MPAIASPTLRRIVWWSALYDLLVTLPFALPWTAGLVIDHFAALHGALALGGELPSFEPMHLFFVNLFGTIVVLWAVLRLRDPQPLYALADSAGRMAFSAWMLLYVSAYGATTLLALFLVPEMVWGLAQLYVDAGAGRLPGGPV